MSIIDRIEELVHLESRAWDEGDADLLLSLFHPEMVWTWPQTGSVDPLLTDARVSRFDPDTWRRGWQSIFDCELVKNERIVRRVIASPEGDAAIAIVDVDAAWRPPNGDLVSWSGRSTKTYVRVAGDWKMIAHMGL